jgi:hypothetical protein
LILTDTAESKVIEYGLVLSKHQFYFTDVPIVSNNLLAKPKSGHAAYNFHADKNGKSKLLTILDGEMQHVDDKVKIKYKNTINYINSFDSYGKALNYIK